MGDALASVDLGTGVRAVQITTGAFHTCALLNNSQVKCWGENIDGELGYGDSILRGGRVNETGDFLPFVGLGSNVTPVRITAGDYHTCVVLKDGRVTCWGYNYDGQLGYGDRRTRGESSGQMGNSLPFVALGPGRTALQIAAGHAHTCAVLENNKVKCWGYAAHGALGYGDKNNRGENPNEMGQFLPFVDLGIGQTTAQITAGIYHTCVLLSNSQVKCWGANGWGQLGYEDTQTRGDGPNEMGDSLPLVDLGMVPTSGSPSQAPTNYNNSNELQNSTKDSSGEGLSPGEIAAAIIVPLIVVFGAIFGIVYAKYRTSTVPDAQEKVRTDRDTEKQVGEGDGPSMESERSEPKFELNLA